MFNSVSVPVVFNCSIHFYGRLSAINSIMFNTALKYNIFVKTSLRNSINEK